MGGAKRLAEKGLDVAVKGATFGAVGTDGDGWAQRIASGENVGLGDVAFGATGTGGAAAGEGVKMMTPKIELPEVVDPKVQEEEAKKKIAAQNEATYGGNRSGLASTLLGGSVSNDGSVLKKKKLLGE